MIYNRFLRALVCQSTGFAYSDFNAPDDDGSPQNVLIPGSDVLRDVLFLKPDATYHLCVYLSLCAAFPSITSDFDDGVISYSPPRFPLPTYNVQGARLLPNAAGAVRVNRVETNWPVSQQIKIACLGGTTQALITTTTESYECPTSYGAGSLEVEWPENIGVSGRLALSDWEPGKVITINHSPSFQAYGAIVTKLSAIGEFSNALRYANLENEFSVAPHDMLRLVIALCAVARTNKGVYNQ